MKKGVLIAVITLLCLNQHAGAVWQRFEAEDLVLSGTYNVFDGVPADDPYFEGSSGPGYVRLQNPSGNLGMIALTINVREAGNYPCRFGLIAPGDQHWDSWSLNDDPSDGSPAPGSASGWLCRENYACAYSWTMAQTILPGNYSQEQWDTFKASLTTYGSGAEPWQVVSMWGPQWGDAGQIPATPMLIPLEAGVNTLYIQAGWGWATYDYIELDVGIYPSNPNPENGGIRVPAAAGAATLGWDNAIDTLDYAQVWFGETLGPEDPNFPTAENYRSKLTMISKITAPGASSTATIPTALVAGKTYTWIVDGFDGLGDPNNNTEPNYPGVFWTFDVNTNLPPVANAGPDQIVWLGKGGTPGQVTVTLDATATTDDGLLSPLTYQWVPAGANPSGTLDNPNAAVAHVTLTALANTTEGTTPTYYRWQLKVNDGQYLRTDLINVYVNTNSCVASNEAASLGIDPAGWYMYGDIAGPDGAGPYGNDCKIDLYDFAEIASNWLGCNNIFEGCD